MTSCHNHEANTIDNMVEAVFEKREMPVFRDFLGSVIPLRQVFVEGYEENQIKLTGIVESEEFAAGFRSVYLKTLAYFAGQYLDRGDEELVREAAKIGEEYVKRALSEQHFPTDWAQFTDLNVEREAAGLRIAHFQYKHIDD